VSRFWEVKTLAEMSREEWEFLCDGCGKCCMYKAKNAFTGQLRYTGEACHLLDTSNRCRNYEKRHDFAHECVDITPENVSQLGWLPWTCAYRRRSEGLSMLPWHPLVLEDE